MKRKPRIYYSDTQKALMWDTWERYLSVSPENCATSATSATNSRMNGNLDHMSDSREPLKATEVLI